MPFPQISSCLICEGARQEVLGKFVLVGFYGVAPNVSIAIRDFTLPVVLCFFFTGGAGDGEFHVTVQLTDSSGKAVSGPSSEREFSGRLLPDKTSSFFIFQLNGLILPRPDVYYVKLIANGKEEYSTTFQAISMTAQTLQEMQRSRPS